MAAAEAEEEEERRRRGLPTDVEVFEGQQRNDDGGGGHAPTLPFASFLLRLRCCMCTIDGGGGRLKMTTMAFLLGLPERKIKARNKSLIKGVNLWDTMFLDFILFQ